MEGDVAAGLPEERDPVANQDRQDRVAHFVDQPETKALGGEGPASDEPDAAERGTQARIHELGEIARAELDVVPGPRQPATSQDEGGRVAVRPAQAPGLETERGLIGSETP